MPFTAQKGWVNFKWQSFTPKTLLARQQKRCTVFVFLGKTRTSLPTIYNAIQKRKNSINHF